MRKNPGQTIIQRSVQRSRQMQQRTAQVQKNAQQSAQRTSRIGAYLASRKKKRQAALKRQQQELQQPEKPAAAGGQAANGGFLRAILLLPLRILVFPFKILELLAAGIYKIIVQVLKYAAFVVLGLFVFILIGNYFDVEFTQACVNLLKQAAMLLVNEVVRFLHR